MSAPVYKTSHIVDGLARLTSKYKDSPNIILLLTAFLEQIQFLEDATLGPLGVRESQTLEGAFAIGGEPLNALGDLIGQPRGGLDDESYLRHIRARVRVNRSQGLPEDAYKIARAIFPDRTEYAIFYTPDYPAAFTIEVRGLTTVPEADDTQKLLQAGAKAGVRVLLIFYLFSLSETFTLSADIGAIETSSALGLGDTGMTTGGHLAGAL